MPGMEAVQVLWAPAVAPLAVAGGGDFVVLPGWQSIKTRGGQTIDNITQVISVGTADIKVRNGDSTGRTPTFVPGTSYKGRQIYVNDPTVIGPLFTGRIDRVEFHYDDTPFGAFVTLHCVDKLGNLRDSAVPDDLFPDTVDYFTQVATVETAINTLLAEIGLTDGVAVTSGGFSNQLVKAPDKFDSRQGLIDYLEQVLLTEGATLFAYGDNLYVRGRWQPFYSISSIGAPGGTGSVVIFTDTNPDPTDPDEPSFRYRRDDLEWSDADEGSVNSVQAASRYLINSTVVVENIPTDYPQVQLSRTDLVTIRQGWVEANARMWETLYNQARSYPKRITFLIAGRTKFEPSMFSLWPGDAANPLFLFQFQVRHTPPGSTQIVYRLAADYLEHDLDRKRGSWLCTVGFTSLDRWWFGYGNGTDLIELVTIDGDSDHGIDSTAIIAP